MTQAHFVKRARKTNKRLGIKKGQPYWWWKFYRRPKQVSQARPRPSQLVRSPFVSSVMSVEENLAETEKENLADAIASACDELQSLADECSSSYDNMPSSLQQGPTGELLQQRVERCEEIIQELEALDPDDDNDESNFDDILSGVDWSVD